MQQPVSPCRPGLFRHRFFPELEEFLQFGGCKLGQVRNAVDRGRGIGVRYRRRGDRLMVLRCGLLRVGRVLGWLLRSVFAWPFDFAGFPRPLSGGLAGASSSCRVRM